MKYNMTKTPPCPENITIIDKIIINYIQFLVVFYTHYRQQHNCRRSL